MSIRQDCPICLKQWPLSDHQITDLGHVTAYLHEDQFFPGWTVLVWKRHVTELFQLGQSERQDLMDRMTELAQVLSETFHAVKINYALLGNQVPHMHWHLVPRLADDPAPQEAIWGVTHQPKRLPSETLLTRVSQIRQGLESLQR